MIVVAAWVLVLVPMLVWAKKDPRLEQLPARFQQWLSTVEKLITKSEIEAFLEIEKDYQRDAFIEQFWKARDPYPQTNRNELRETWEARWRDAQEIFGDMRDARAQMYLVNGQPHGRVEVRCVDLYPAEVWFYDGREFHAGDVLLLFYQRYGRGAWVTWQPLDGVEGLSKTGSISGGLQSLLTSCPAEDALRAAIGYLSQLGQMGIMTLEGQLDRLPERPKTEWVASFQAYSTDLEEGAETFDAEVRVGFPGRFQSRTVMQATVLASPEELEAATLGDYSAYNLLITGEVLSGETLLDSFRVKYDFPAVDIEAVIAAAQAGQALDAGGGLPLVFDRYLRPGTYRLVVKVEDVNSGRAFRDEREVEVPKVDGPAPVPLDAETARILDEANASIRSGDTTVQIAPLQGEWQTGLVRIDAMTTGTEVATVSFLLDGQKVLTKRSPPYNVELDLGDVPRPRELRVEAYDGGGEEIASDEVLINGGRHRFAVRLIEPRRGKRYARSLRAEADVLVPEGEGVERVEFFVNETKVATVFQPPYVQPIVLPENEPIAYVRAVAYTPDGSATDDWVFVNAPDDLDILDVQYVELFTAVLDRDKRPVDDLLAADFTIQEDGVPQEIARFEVVRDLPIHAAIMLDVSASMEDRLQGAQAAALRFFEQAVTPKDRAAVVTFNDHPNLTTSFTNEVGALAGGLAGVKAERGTALWDSLVFTLYYFNGIKGQRTILLLSDGNDENSRFAFDDTLEYARRAGVTLYPIGLALPKTALDARRKLSKLAAETGGRSFFIESVAELDAVYETIQHELRSRYLLTYQSTNTSGAKDFRTIDVELGANGLEAKTLRGYYP